MENKTDLRIKIKRLRKDLDIGYKSHMICDKIKSWDVFIKANNIMLFYPVKYEINLLDLRECGKNIFFPKVDGNDLYVCPDYGIFEKSYFNINEPCSNPISPDILDLIIVPALAVDKSNYRLGYGGGFYDRFLALYPDIMTVTPICKEFIYEKLPTDNYDIPVNYVISD